MANWRNIPQELKDKKQWVCWALEDRDGKPAKVPKNPNSDGNAMPNEPSTWSVFGKATWKTGKSNYSGIGFMFNGDGILGVDIDKCRDPQTGSLNEVAKDIITTLDSYTEISQSGTGIHIICTGKLPEGKRRKDSVEMYENGRFFIMTGDIFDDGHSTIEDRTQELLIIHNRYLGNTQKKTQTKKVTPSITHNLNDSEIIEKAMAATNGNRFRELFNGDTRMNNNDDSAADMALCNLLAFWTAKDHGAMDRIFRQSSLYRAKWDEMRGEHTYGEKTILEAINGTNEVFTPGLKNSKPAAVLNIAPEVDLGYDKLYGPVVEEPIVHSPFKGEDTTSDLGRSKIFSKKYIDKVLWCRDVREWFIWNGRKWKSGAEMQVIQLAKEIVPDMILTANRLVMSATGEEELKTAKSIYRDTIKIKGEKCLKSMIELAKSDMFVDARKFDADPFLLNCQNGIVDLRTGQLYPHDHAAYVSKITNANYEPGKQFKLFGDFLKQITCDDAELEQYFQEICGMAAIGKVFHEGMCIFYGTGQNGKSTFLNCISKIFGTYSCEINPEMLMAQRDGKQPVGVTMIDGKRFATAFETEEGRRLSGAMLKRLASADPITGRELYQKERTFEPSHTLILSTNHLPKVGSTDTGTWRRIAVVPFKSSIQGKKQIKDYAGVLYNTDADAILSWIVDGAGRYIRNHFHVKVPAVVKQSTEDYCEGEDWVSRFISECCDIGNFDENGNRLFASYDVWREDNGEYRRSSNEFAKALKDKDFEKKHSYCGTKWIGIRVKPEIQENMNLKNLNQQSSFLDEDGLNFYTRQKM